MKWKLYVPRTGRLAACQLLGCAVVTIVSVPAVPISRNSFSSRALRGQRGERALSPQQLLLRVSREQLRRRLQPREAGCPPRGLARAAGTELLPSGPSPARLVTARTPPGGPGELGAQEGVWPGAGSHADGFLRHTAHRPQPTVRSPSSRRRRLPDWAQTRRRWAVISDECALAHTRLAHGYSVSTHALPRGRAGVVSEKISLTFSVGSAHTGLTETLNDFN